MNRIKPFTTKQIVFIRKAFMIKGVQQGFEDWFDHNLISRANAHSFIQLCFDEFKHCENYREEQQVGWTILDYMRLKYLNLKYDMKSLKEAVSKIEYTHPLDQLKQEADKIDKLNTKYLIKGLAKDHPANKDFNNFMQKKKR